MSNKCANRVTWKHLAGLGWATVTTGANQRRQNKSMAARPIAIEEEE